MYNILAILLTSCALSSPCCSKNSDKLTGDTPQRIIITGKIFNRLPENKTIVLAINRVGFGQEEQALALDGAGSFSFEFTSYIATDVWLAHGTNFQLLVHPGDSIHVVFDGSKGERAALLKTILISGDRVETNNQITSFQRSYYGSVFFSNWQIKDKAIRNLQPNEFKRFADSLRTERKKFLEAFMRANALNQEAQIWTRLFIEEVYVFDLTYYPTNHRETLALKSGEWGVPLSYYDYFKIYYPIEGTLYGGALMKYSEQYLAWYIGLRVNDRVTKMNGKSDWVLIDSIYVETIKDFTDDSLLKEILITKYFNDRLRENDLDAVERNLPKIKSLVTSPFLKKPLLETYETLNTTVEKSNFVTDVKSLGLRIKSENSFMDKIVTKYNGSPLYIDFWATWCAPCLAEFEYSKKLRNELNDVTFIYVCIDSKETAFQNTIKKFQLDGNHYFLSLEESDQVRKEFDIGGIPTYILVDKKGLVLSKGFNLRPSENATKNEIVRLLKADD